MSQWQSGGAIQLSHELTLKASNKEAKMAWHLYYTTYGTWLHGDERGSADVSGYVPPNDGLEQHRRNKLEQEPFLLAQEMRTAVDSAIKEVCEHRGWKLYALNVRSNHVHVVVGNAEDRNAIIRDFKAYSTRRLRRDGLIPDDRKVWTKRCGHRYLFDDDYLNKAIHYVLHRQ
ncbi:MAG: transposase [Planctomycetota bacterium]